MEDIINWLLSPLQAFFHFIVNLAQGFVAFLVNIVDWFAGAIRTIGQFIADIITFLIDFIGSAIRLAHQFLIIVGLIIEIILNLISILGAWFFQMIALIGRLIGELFTAQPVPLPGIPQCISNPRAHDLCGVWHLWDSTIFKGSVGAAIVSVILIVIDVMIVFYFAKQVLKFLRMGEGVTDVS